MDNSCKVPEVKPITIKRFGTAGLVPTVPTTLDCNLWQKTDLKDGEFAINTVDDKLYIRSGNQIIELTNQSSGGGTGTVTSIATAGLISGGTITTTGTITTSMNTNKLVGRGTAGTGVMEEITLGTNLSLSGTTLNATDQFTGTVTSVGLTMPSAFTVTNSPITSSGDIAVTGAGLANQYVRGDGSLANFPTNGGGGSAVNYYLNGSVNQGTFGGDTYYELSKTPIIGAGTNFTRTNAQGNGYIASFITDAGDPNLLNIPGGNWALEFYFNANSGGGSPTFYGELYKVSNTNVFTLIASGSTNPEGITQGTTVDQYFTSIPVPQTTLLATDRLAIRVYVNTGGRNITLHTEDNNLCQIITTFSTGLNALNGLTAQVQNFAVGTSGTDFAINSVTDTHTFNLPTASALNRGALSSADWSTFNNKVSTGAITGSGLTMATARLLGRSTAGSGAVEEITIGSGLTLSAGTLTAAGGGITIGTTAIASGTVNRILFEGAGNVVQQDSTFVWENTDKRLILGTEAVANTNSRLVVIGKGTGTNTTFAVHNSTGTNNSLIVRDDNFIGFGTATEQSITGASTNFIRANISSTNYLSLFSNGGVFIGAGATGVSTGSAGIGFRCIAIGFNAEANTTGNQGADQQGIAIGQSALAYGGGIAIGSGARTGFAATTGGAGAIAIGHGVIANNNSTPISTLSNIAIGSSAGILQSCINIGRNNTFTGSNFNSTGYHTILGSNLTINSASGRNSIVALGWGNNTPITIGNSFQIYLGGQNERSFFLNSNGNVVLRNNQTIVSATNFDANATNTITINNGTAPATNIATSFQLYSANISGAGTAAPHFRTENGDVVRLYRIGGWGLPTGAFTRTTFDTTTVTLEQLAERVAALIQDLRDNHQLLKA